MRDFIAALEDEGLIRDRARRALIGKHARIFQTVCGYPAPRSCFRPRAGWLRKHSKPRTAR